MQTFEQALDLPAEQPFYIIPGPIGTELGRDGLPTSLHDLMVHPDGEQALTGKYYEYAESGASFIVAYTFGAQIGRDRSVTQSEADQERNIVSGVRLATKVASECDIPVVASISPISDCYVPHEGKQLPYDELVAVQRRMIRLAQDGGATLAIGETFSREYEATAFAEAAAEENMPFGLSWYVVRDKKYNLRLPRDRLLQPEKRFGPLLGRATGRLLELSDPPSLVGTNCMPLKLAVDAVREQRAAARGKKVLIGTWPNGNGMPDNTPAAELANIARDDPDLFLQTIVECMRRGAVLVGGCCCTTPEDTADLRELVDAWPRS